MRQTMNWVDGVLRGFKTKTIEWNEKWIIVYEAFVESVFHVADELERLSNLPIYQLENEMDSAGIIRLDYSLRLPKHLTDEAMDEFKRACKT